MARCILAWFNFTPTPSWPKRGDLRKIEPLRVGDRGTLGWEEPRQGGSSSNPFGQPTTTSAVLFFKV
ncbi:hypothetical protein [Oscillatoria sp. HE19RPO]|uniref:hypothetical protein n=1 Tax=Oscillatoria sp. HE19RPO TaxID=2954806 RepID=UPI0020C2838B|nr:hypothetical protein [Oscillatoria sp. HE19RPO]